jgi:archaellum component FlaF (FlaF/FlaG flagellin family)
MAFSTITAYIVLFLVLLSFVSGIFILNDTLARADRAIIITRGDKELEYIRTHITITNATHNGTFVNITLINDGRQTLETDCIDLIINSRIINRDNFATTILNTTRNPLFWDPGESLRITSNVSLDANSNYTTEVITCNAVKATDILVNST